MYGNLDVSDHRMLQAVRDSADPDGTVNSHELAAHLNVDGAGRKVDKYEVMGVAQRLSWMARYEYLEKVEDSPRPVRYRLTEEGKAITDAEMSASVENAIDRMAEGAMVLAMRHLVTTGFVAAKPAIANAVRREYQHTSAKRGQTPAPAAIPIRRKRAGTRRRTQ